MICSSENKPSIVGIFRGSKITDKGAGIYEEEQVLGGADGVYPELDSVSGQIRTVNRRFRKLCVNV
jgi:hypothetical protein